MQIEDVIDPITADYISNSFKTISQNPSTRLVVIEINTPGGLITSMKSIITEIFSSSIPVVTYVTPRGASADSAGFLITIAGDIAAMSPATNMGAAHPVLISPIPSSDPKKDKDSEKEKKGEQKDVMEEKVVNATAAYVKSIAKSRNRNIELSELAVRESKSYTAEECLKHNLIEYIAVDLADLLRQLDGKEVVNADKKTVKLDLKGQEQILLEMTKRQKFLKVISNPTLAILLFLLGIAGLFIEFTHPGIIVPGVLGGIMLVLAFMAFQILPVNYIGLILIMLSVGFFIAEIKIQGFGMFGIGGIVSLLLGSIILVKKVPIPEMRPSMSLIITIALGLGLIFFFLSYKVMQVMRRKSETGQEGLVGKTGVAKTDITPEAGKVFTHGEWWNAVSDEPIPKDSKIVVESVRGFVLKVKKIGG